MGRKHLDRLYQETKQSTRKRPERTYLDIGLGLLSLLLLLWTALLFEPLISGQPYNETAVVNVTVNISNSAPVVFDVTLPTPIDLIAYDNLIVQCNFTVYDFDNNTLGANATLYHSSVSSLDEPNNNYLYQNNSCSQVTPTDYYTDFICTFAVSYYANNGTWYCNATAYDTLDGVSTNLSNPAIVNPLVAIRMPLLLDYGELAVNQISNDTLANITNAGNRHANISVEGYGQVPGDGLAFVCDSGSIAVSYQRYNITANSTYEVMHQLTGSTAMIPGFYVPQRTSPSEDSINITYWKIAVPVGAGGVCQGKILFTATDRGN
jgi:hypothetical protein